MICTEVEINLFGRCYDKNRPYATNIWATGAINVVMFIEILIFTTYIYWLQSRCAIDKHEMYITCVYNRGFRNEDFACLPAYQIMIITALFMRYTTQFVLVQFASKHQNRN